MTTVPAGMNGFRKILEQKEDELVRVLRRRDDIAIEKSADQMDEIQYASERDLAIQNADRESTSWREVKAALRRMDEGVFGICIDCESPINPKRLAVLAWAPRCVRCQDAVDQGRREGTEALGDDLVYVT